MLADQLDYIVGVDPHHDSHSLAVVHVQSGAVVFESTLIANSDGYAHWRSSSSTRTPRVGVRSRLKGQARSVPASRASLAVGVSGCSRSAGCAGSAAPAARPTRS